MCDHLTLDIWGARILVAFWIVLSSVHAQDAAFTYQGALTDKARPASGIYDFIFTVYDGASDQANSTGGPLTNTAVQVENGLFTCALDFGTAAFQGGGKWLQIYVRTNNSTAGFTALNLRQYISPYPYSIYSDSARFASNAATAQLASEVLPGTVATTQLQTPAIPNAGQVLAFNGQSLVWSNPPLTSAGAVLSKPSKTDYATNNKIVPKDTQTIPLQIEGIPNSWELLRISDAQGSPLVVFPQYQNPGPLLAPTTISRGSITLHAAQLRNYPADARFLQFVPTIENTPTYVQLFPAGRVPTDPVTGNSTVTSLQLFHSDFRQFPTNYEALEMSAEVVGGTPVFHINTFATGTGRRRPFQIRVDGNLAVDFSDTTAVRFAIPPRLPAYSLATRPKDTPAGSIIFVTDAPEGTKFQAWDGTKWVPLG